MPMERLGIIASDIKVMYNVITKKFEATVEIHDIDTNTTEIIYFVEKK